MPVKVKGYREFLRACDKADRDLKRMVRAELRAAGDIIKRDASRRFAPISPKSAAKYRTAVRQRGVAVEQSLRKTTGKHPEWGALQMTKALIPASQAKEHEVELAFDAATDRICDRFQKGP